MSNLIPMMDRTPEERKAIASKGGKAKAERAKQRKAVADTFNEILALEYDPDKNEPFKLEWHRNGASVLDEGEYWINLQGQPLLTRLCAEIVKAGMKGDLRASALILRYIAPDD